jgi:hypothetical protein
LPQQTDQLVNGHEAFDHSGRYCDFKTNTV